MRGTIISQILNTLWHESHDTVDMYNSFNFNLVTNTTTSNFLFYSLTVDTQFKKIVEDKVGERCKKVVGVRKRWVDVRKSNREKEWKSVISWGSRVRW